MLYANCRLRASRESVRGVILTWTLALVASFVGACAGTAPVPSVQSTAVPAPTVDAIATAKAAYQRVADKANAIAKNPVSREPKAVAAQMERYMTAVTKGLLDVEIWPSDVKPYVDDVIQAATEVRAAFSFMAGGFTRDGLSTTMEATGRLEGKVDLLRAALGLPIINRSATTAPFF